MVDQMNLIQLLITDFDLKNRDTLLSYDIESYFTDMDMWLWRNEQQREQLNKNKAQSSFE